MSLKLDLKLYLWYNSGTGGTTMYIASSARQDKMTAEPKKYPQGYFKDKKCRWCSSVFQPKAPSHHYCSQHCAEDAASEKYLWLTYKISLKDYLDLYEKQNKECSICSSKGFKMQAHHKLLLVVDHCHQTGRVRGLLCHNCNRGLGLFQDNSAFLLHAAAYVTSSEQVVPSRSLDEVNIKWHNPEKHDATACSIL
jgi:hypothetical protein